MDDNWNKPFWRSVFSGTEGAGSLSRIAVFIIVVSAVGWVSFIVIRKCALPDLAGLTLWVTTVTTSLYGMNKIAGVMASKNACKTPEQQEGKQ